MSDTTPEKAGEFFDESGEFDPDALELFRRANPSLYPDHPVKVPDTYTRPKELTVGELVAELLKFDQDAKVYRHDSEYGPEPVERVEIQEAVTYRTPNGPASFPEMIVIS